MLSLPPNHAINPKLSMLDFKEQVEIANTKARYQELDNVGEEEDEEPTSPGMERLVKEQSAMSMIPFDDTTHSFDFRKKKVTEMSLNSKVYLPPP